MSDSERTAFLAAIADSPEDDAPRLVFADWLDEHGESAYAEFVRIQCARAEVPRSDRRFEPLAKREAELLARHEVDWRARLPVVPRLSWGPFERGFVESATCASLAAVLPLAETVFTATPLIRLRLLNVFGGLAVRNPAFFTFCNLPAVTRLRSLVLGGNRLTVALLNDLFASPLYPTLTELRLNDNAIGVRETWAIARAPAGRLHRLALGNNQIGDEGLAALATWTGATSLVDLDLQFNEITSVGVGHLADVPHFRNLSRLVLWGNPVANTPEVARERFGDVARLTLPR